MYFQANSFHVFRNGLKVHLHGRKRRYSQIKQRQKSQEIRLRIRQCEWVPTGEAFVWWATNSYSRVFTEQGFEFYSLMEISLIEKSVIR